MDEFVTEFDLTNQQIVFLNEIDSESRPTTADLDFIHSPVVNDNEYEPFVEIENSSLNNRSISNAVQEHQFHILQNRNGVRHMKFRKPKKLRKKSSPKKLVDLYKCTMCNESFNVLENLTLHISLHKGDGRCPQCGKIFRRLASLEGHIKTHFKNEYFMCTFQGCGEMSRLEWMLKEHINQFHPNTNLKLQQEKEELAKARKQTRKIPLNCHYCGKQFSKNCLLIRHERIHNGQKPFKCSECERCFAQKNTLLIHQLRHSDQRIHKCSQCPQAFVQKGNLISHVTKCHTYKEGEIRFQCNKCSCLFKKIGTLNAHISKFHTSQGVLMESETELGFKVDDVMQQLNELHRPSSLETELVSKELFFNLPVSVPVSTSEEVSSSANLYDAYSENRNVTTPLSSQLKLAVHTNGMVTHRNVMQRIDGNIRWYICLYCPKEFRRPSDLVRHIRIHTKEKPFACSVTDCKKRFSVKSSLNMHLNTHFKSSKEHICHVCSQTFDSADAFDDHCRLSHKDSPMFQCFICSQLCITNGDLKHHLKCHRSPTKSKKLLEQKEDDDDIQLDIIMKEPILLTNDGKIEETVQKKVLDQKQDQRKFECTVCLSSFKRKGHLKEHVLSHLGLKSHKCEICDKYFGKMSILKRHLLYHSNEKKFKCGICNASFVSNNQLSRHNLKHTTQRNVMCPYCRKRFKSKATCRTHMLIHKSEWVKQFKEQIKTGAIQFEEEGLPESNESVILDVITSSTNDGNEETVNPIDKGSLYPSIQDVQEINGSVFLTNLVQENEITNLDNRFEYFLLLPTIAEANESGTGSEFTAENEQFVVNDEPLSLHFIQMEQPSVLDDMPESSSTNHLKANYQLEPIHPSDAHVSSELQLQEINLNTDSNPVNAPVPQYEETQKNRINVTASQLNQMIPKPLSHSTTRTRKSTKCVNKCEICSKIFQKPIDLRRHIRTHTLEKPFHCHICPKAFALKSTLKNHLKTHEDIKQMFPCTVCWKAYSSRHSMITHMLIHLNSREHKCEYCTITFRTRGHLKIHQQVHLRESRALGVNPCDIKTRKEKAKLQPLLNVINECGIEARLNVINECGIEATNGIRTFTDTVRVDRLEATAESHMVDKTNYGDSLNAVQIYQCTCLQQFSDFNEYKIHLRTHKEKFRCSDCDKVFTKPSLLERHRTVHSGRKEFVCQICQKSYTQKVTLQAHMSLHTAGGALFECSKCQKKCNFKTNLTSHERECNLFNNHLPANEATVVIT